MKRIVTFMATLLLSAVIVLLGGGLTLVHCSHSGSTTVAQWQGAASTTPSAESVSDTGCCHHAEQPSACAVSSRCMQLTVVSLPQIFSHPSPTFSFQPLVAELPPQLLATPLPELLQATDDATEYTSVTFHGPPRQWLRMLTTLQI